MHATRVSCAGSFSGEAPLQVLCSGRGVSFWWSEIPIPGHLRLVFIGWLEVDFWVGVFFCVFFFVVLGSRRYDTVRLHGVWSGWLHTGHTTSLGFLPPWVGTWRRNWGPACVR